jgi:hypothetical protein
MSESVGINIVTQCNTCIILEERCPDCQEAFDTNQTIKAHELVDEGNVQYHKQWLKDNDQESNHEWVGSETRIKPYFVWVTQSWEDTRREYLPPVTDITDRMDTPEDMLELQPYEKICNWCHLAFSIKATNCVNCEQADA